MNIAALIDERARQSPARACIHLENATWSWDELHQHVSAAALQLHEAGAAPGTVIAQSFTSEPLQLLAMLATARLGATVFSLPSNTPAPRRRRMLEDVGATMLATDLVDFDDQGLTTVRLQAEPQPAHASAGAAPLVSDPQAPWIIASGSGSTGKPKYLPITHRQQWARMEAGHGWLPFGEEDVLLSLIGLDFYASKLRYLEAFARGAAILLPDRARLDLRAAAVDRYSVLYGTVFHMEQLLSLVPEGSPAQLQSLRALMVGGSVVSASLRARIRDRLCPRLYVLYGANECSTSCRTGLDDVYTIPGNVGHPHPGFELQIVDAEDQPLPIGEAGLVRIRSATRIDGYLGDPVATAQAFRDDWFYPGDLGRLAPGGQLIHLGRADDLMIMNGINIYPAEIEQTLLAHPAVRDAAAMPIRHRVHQDVPVAAVSLQAGIDVAAKDLLRFVHERIGGHALHQVFILEEIPRNEQGKPLRQEIRAQVARSQTPSEIEPVRTETPRPTRQLARRLGRTFRVPQQPDLAALDRWLQILEDDLPPSASPSHDASPVGDELARLWLARCLRLARLLLQELRAPVFDTPTILDCIAEEGDGGLWRGQFELALVDGLSPAAYATALNAAFALAEWATKHDQTLENREIFFSKISERVLAPFENRQPAGKSTFQVLRVANRLGIPFRALGSGVYQLGWGAKARRIDRSMTDGDSLMGISLSSSKPLTAQLLRAAGLPAPVHEVVGTSEAARAAAERIGWPVVVKPADRDRGEGVTVDVTADGLQSAFAEALRASRAGQVIVERQAAGVCHRLFVAGGGLLYAVKRLPMGVYGDGSRTVAALVEDECAAQRLKPAWKRSGIGPVDELGRAALAAAGMTEQSVAAAGAFVPLRRIESTAWGGVDEEVTSAVHPENLRVALAATALFGLDVAGIDIISPDIAQPWHSNGAIVNEVNYSPVLGGGDISRRYIPEYLGRLLDGDGRIPVEVFVGGDAAWQAALGRWEALRAAGQRAFLSSANRTLDGNGVQVPMPISGLYHRARALVLSPLAQALVLVVQTDELLQTGLPLERVDRVVPVDREVVSARDPSRAIAEEHSTRLARLLSGWS